MYTVLSVNRCRFLTNSGHILIETLKNLGLRLELQRKTKKRDRSYIEKGYDRSEKRHGAQEKGMALQEKGMAQRHAKRAWGKHYFYRFADLWSQLSFRIF